MEKELVKSFIKACKYNIDVDKNESDEFNKNYEILYSQIMSGNDSKEIKRIYDIRFENWKIKPDRCNGHFGFIIKIFFV